jgi:hypothetical protein
VDLADSGSAASRGHLFDESASDTASTALGRDGREEDPTDPDATEVAPEPRDRAVAVTDDLGAGTEAACLEIAGGETFDRERARTQGCELVGSQIRPQDLFALKIWTRDPCSARALEVA